MEERLVEICAMPDHVVFVVHIRALRAQSVFSRLSTCFHFGRCACFKV